MKNLHEMTNSANYTRMVDALLTGNLALAGNLSVDVAVKAIADSDEMFRSGENTQQRVDRLVASRAVLTIAQFVGGICANAVMDALDDDDSAEMDDFNSSLGSHIDPSDCFPSLDAAAKAVK
jgi:hypothetical protein